MLAGPQSLYETWSDYFPYFGDRRDQKREGERGRGGWGGMKGRWGDGGVTCKWGFRHPSVAANLAGRKQSRVQLGSGGRRKKQWRELETGESSSGGYTTDGRCSRN